MRKIKRIFWHSSATREGDPVKAATIKKWHLDRGFRDIGYHFVIELDGKVVPGRPVSDVGAHTKGHNKDSIGICYVGGCDKQMRPKDTRTPAQKAAMYELTEELLARHPEAKVHGHREFVNTACPSFDVQKDWAEYLRSK